MEICALWFEGKLGPTKIVERLKNEHEYILNREAVYSALREAGDRGFIRLSPAVSSDLSMKLSERFSGSIQVVSTGEFSVHQGLAAKAAELVIERIKHHERIKKDDKIRLGLGAGLTTRNIASDLASLYHSDPGLPDLVVHALTSGFRSDRAHLSPISWFSWFIKEANKRVSFVGLFAPPMVPSVQMYNEIKKLPGVAEAYSLADEIDIVVTSIGNAADSVGRWLPYVEEGKKPKLLEAGWLGDVLYCPFSGQGPISGETLGLNAVTLFSIPDLVKMARSGKRSVILVCGPSHSADRKRKTAALAPLLKNSELRVWTHIIMDVGTAQELLSE